MLLVFCKTQTEDDKLDRPVGQGQYDYLRRINEQLQSLDNDLRLKRVGKKIDAIGIIGSDVFDKLLILRALRPEFPEALFFTTGFDEAFTMPSEIPWTRNLIISSSFGPKLSSRYQGPIPSFRDTRQSQAFLATQLAIDDLMAEPAGGADVKAKLHAEGLRREVRLRPRVFEIERNGHPLQIVGPVPAGARQCKDCPDPELRDDWLIRAAAWLHVAEFGFSQAKSAPASSAERATSEPGAVGDTEEEREYLYPRYEVDSRNRFTVGLIILALISGFALFLPQIRRWAKVEFALICAGFVVGAALSANWGIFARWLTGGGE